jgi:hypothetical protein
MPQPTPRGEVFVPLEIEIIEEGGFLLALNKVFQEAQNAIIALKRQHGADQCAGLKATIQASVEIKLDPARVTLFQVKTNIKKGLPVRPAVVTLGQESSNEAPGIPAQLLVRAAGSSDTPPQQAVMDFDAIEDGLGEAATVPNARRRRQTA